MAKGDYDTGRPSCDERRDGNRKSRMEKKEGSLPCRENNMLGNNSNDWGTKSSVSIRRINLTVLRTFS